MAARMIPHEFERLDFEEQQRRADSFYDEIGRRRSVRFFSDDPVPRHLVEQAIRTASTAPSGAHRQPWRFVLTGDPQVKSQIRAAAEEEERVNYEGGRLPEHWLEALEPLGTDWHKPFLETVPWIVVMFEERYGVNSDGSKRHNFSKSHVASRLGCSSRLSITWVWPRSPTPRRRWRS